MKKAKNLILITDQYPTDEAGDGCFIEDEIAYYASEFERVLIFPKTIGSKSRPLPPNVEFTGALAKSIDKLKSFRPSGLALFLRAFFSAEYREERRQAPGIYGKLKLLYYVAKAYATAAVIRDEASRKSIALKESVAYSFWFDGCAYGCALLRPTIHAAVTRVHGADLYEERHRKGYIPLRARSIDALSLIACISETGATYLSNRFPKYKDKIELHPLGMHDASKGKRQLVSNEFDYIVSCSSLIPLKRVELIVQALALAREGMPKRVKWAHFGDGPERQKIQRMAASLLNTPDYELFGSRHREEILDFYRNESVLGFITTSSTEGRPMSIAEALCFGIPVIATAVGGIPDLVTSGNGALLPENPTPEEVSEAIVRIVLDPDSGLKRAAARAVWEDKCSADSITKNFARCLSEGLGVSAAPSPNRPSPD